MCVSTWRLHAGYCWQFFLMPLAPKADNPYSTGGGGGSGSSTGQGEQPDDSQDEQADNPEAEPQS